MQLTEIFKLALEAIRVNKLRSALTSFGIIIGVAAIILLVSIGSGLQNYVTDQFKKLGANSIFILPGKVQIA
ncbi:MAG: ABC transporter permease, partial [Candidatus Magasanikbacteria bacterium]|nr:ABC transporter permease [Candidatus Magasanikbacteria bacterium]